MSVWETCAFTRGWRIYRIRATLRAVVLETATPKSAFIVKIPIFRFVVKKCDQLRSINDISVNHYGAIKC